MCFPWFSLLFTLSYPFYHFLHDCAIIICFVFYKCLLFDIFDHCWWWCNHNFYLCSVRSDNLLRWHHCRTHSGEGLSPGRQCVQGTSSWLSSLLSLYPVSVDVTYSGLKVFYFPHNIPDHIICAFYALTQGSSVPGWTEVWQRSKNCTWRDQKVLFPFSWCPDFRRKPW